jgi:plasmid stabilization system protein ParE
MTRFVFTRKAEMDLEQISDYIGERNPEAANGLLDQFEKAFHLLAESPKIGHSRPDLTKQKLKFWPVDSYLIIYKEADPLEIVRVLSGLRNLIAII